MSNTEEKLRQVEQSINLLEAKYERRLDQLKADWKADCQTLAGQLKSVRESLEKN